MTENAALIFEDECSLSNTATINYAWAPKGQQPLVAQKQHKRERQTLFGTVEPLTGKVIAKASDNGNAKTFKAFLVKVLHEYKSKEKITMVLDNVRYHHAKMLKPFLEHHKDKLELLFLPAYSPDFNPMERAWWYMRKKISHHRYCQQLHDRKNNFWRLFSHFQKENQFMSKICNINYSV